MNKMRSILLLTTALILLACGLFPYEVTITKSDPEQGAEQTAATNTSIVFDTNTPVLTMTKTLVPSATLAPSSTPRPTKTLIPTKTLTLTPTITRTPTKTIYYCPQAAIGTPCP